MILDRILEHKRAEVCRLKETAGLKSMIRAVDRLPPARSLSGSLSRPGRVALLAEIKGASPSRGVIRENFLPAWVAGVYSSNGADALGFVFAPGRRGISPERAREIIKKLHPFISRVGVFVNPTLEEVLDTAGHAGLDTVQLHGDETPEFCSRIPCRVIKSFALSGRPDPGQMSRYRVDAWLLDTLVAGCRGGSDRPFDWRLACGLQVGPLIVSGGLTPENVREAIETIRPYAVDVSSGVEFGGRKDPRKIIDFIRVKG